MDTYFCERSRVSDAVSIMTEQTREMQAGRLRFTAIRDDRFKMSRLSFNFILPKDREKTPLTKLMLSVMLRGSQKYPTVTELNKALDELYGATVSLRDISVGDKCVFKISCKLLDGKYVFDGDNTDILREVLNILSDVIYSPLKDENGYLCKDNIDSEKKIAIDAIRAQINDQRAYASRACDKIMLDGTPYGILPEGNEQIISEFTQRQITENIQYFLDNVNVECYYIGNDDPDRVFGAITEKFSFPCNENSLLDYGEKAFASTHDDVRFATDDMPVSQGRLELGYSCGVVLADREHDAMAVFNEIFGGSSVSKLFMNVREKKSLCYYCYSSYHSSLGTVKVGCGMRSDNKDKVLDEISYQLERIKCGDVSDGEISVAKRTLISGIRQVNDSSAAIESFLLRYRLAGIGRDIASCINGIEVVTRDEIVRAANKVKLDTVYFLNGNGQTEDNYDE